MKKFILACAYSILALFVSVSCKKNSFVEPKISMLSAPINKRVSLEEAKNLYENKLKSIGQRNSNLLEKYPRWYEAYNALTANNLSKIHIPLNFNGKQAAYRLADNPESNRTRKSDVVQLDLVVYRDENEELNAFVLRSIASEDYLKANHFKVNHQNFTGIKIVEDWEGNFVKGFQYTNGQLTGSLTKADNTNQRDGSNCTYTVLDVFYRDCYDGNCGSWTYAGSDILNVSCGEMNSQNDSELAQTAEGGGGGSVGDPISDPEPNDGLDEVQILIEDECMRELVEEMLEGNSPAADSVRKYFGVGKKILRFEQNSSNDVLMPANQSGSTSFGNLINVPTGQYPNHPSQIASISIELNGTALMNASQEYIAETMTHEIWHANMYMNGIIPANNQDHIQHQNMLTNPYYLTQTVSSLQSQFPNLSAQDAQAIFFSGFGQFINSSVANRNLWLQALQNNGLTENFVNTRAEQYRTGQAGTPKCD